MTVDGNTYTTKITSTSTITVTAPDRTVYVTLDEDEPTNAPTSSTNVGTTSTSPVQTSEAQASTPNTSSTAAQTSQVVLSSSRPIPTSSQAISSSSSAPTRTTQDSFTSSTEGTPILLLQTMALAIFTMLKMTRRLPIRMMHHTQLPLSIR